MILQSNVVDESIKVFSDRFSYTDIRLEKITDIVKKSIRPKNEKAVEGIDVSLQNKGIWRRTEVIGGFGEVIFKKGKKTRINGNTFNESNMVPIGGVQYMMEDLFGVQCDQFSIPTMYASHGIGAPDSASPNETYLTPDGERKILKRYGHMVNLFSVGVTGTAENDVTVYPVDYRDKDLNLTKVTDDGQTLKGKMIPFRYTAADLSSTERKQYFGKYVDDEGFTSYYYKRFETDPVIRHVWKTGEDVEEETLVSADEVWNNMSGLNAVESYTEIILKVSKKDVKEWYLSLEQEDRTRINTIALLTGRFVIDEETTGVYGDYQDVRLFSKLVIPVEYLTLSKDLNIIYRVYGA